MLFFGISPKWGAVVISGLLSAIVYNWLVLRNLERGQLKWSAIQWVLAALTLFFTLYLGYSAVFLLFAAMEYHYYPWASLALIGAGMLLTFSLGFHLFLSGRENLVKKDE
jgi:hypothetical protein